MAVLFCQYFLVKYILHCFVADSLLLQSTHFFGSNSFGSKLACVNKLAFSMSAGKRDQETGIREQVTGNCELKTKNSEV